LGAVDRSAASNAHQGDIADARAAPDSDRVDLLGLPFLLLAVAVGGLVVAAVAATWNRWPTKTRWPARIVGLALVLLVGAALAGVVVNRSFGLYSSLSELTDRPSRLEPVDSFAAPSDSSQFEVLTPDWQHAAATRAAADSGILLRVRLRGARSRISRVGLVYLPAAYSRNPTSRFPALELFHGTPGGPNNYADQLDVSRVLDEEIDAGRIPPVVAVLPMIDDGRSGECVDGVHGPRDETYLAGDVPADVEAALRVLPGRSFAVLGYSTGGFCAVNLALRHPDRYVAAGSISGYFVAGTDPAVGNPYGRDTALRERNSPLWLVERRRPAAPPLLVVAAAGDTESVRDERAFVSAAHQHDPRLVLGASLLPHGGHTFATWSAVLPATIDWVAHYLPRDLAPPLRLPALT
jgi:S-formylglutathione hydrolase FrmB